ncbi:response regulator [Phormidium sp. CLA17]|uniref:response regulator n=1 Tax=Leptolyngbya sp. Cla-17 TaxID=2803751 RepID=UPI0014924355|nr:response regulator [Leptolyngbya sp. Cla-17]MBM0740698.1 response regulator [Leptolyngbya sp. Cla-17]
MKILLVEDDEILTKALTKTLTTHHHIVDVVKDGEMGWTYGSTFEYDLMVLDIVLPKLDGISLCQRFRANGYATPIMLLTAQDSKTVNVQGLDAGADDYVVKPFDPVELMARIRALQRRSGSNPFPLLAWGALFLDPRTCEVTYNSQPLSLTTKEYEFLELLLRDSQYVFSSEELIDRLWSSEDFPSEATVRSHLRRIRQKLTAAGAPPDFIATLHGRGYYLKAIAAEVTTQDSFPYPKTDSVDLDQTPSETGLANRLEPVSGEDGSLDSQQQYLDFLNETWVTTQPKSLDQLAVVFQTVTDLQRDRLTSQQQAAAQQATRTLVGTLGIFGLSKITHLVRQLDYWIGGREPLQPKQAPLMQALVTALQQEVQNTTQIQRYQIPDQQRPQLLLVSSNVTFNQSLQMAATRCGIQLEVVQTLELAEWEELQTNIVLLKLPAESDQANSQQPTANSLLETLQTVTQRYPALPVLVMSDRGDLSDRLEVLRCGGRLFLTAQTPIEQVIAEIVQLLEKPNLPTRVMIVDGDRTWLSTLPTLLKPWGFKVTTLADPQQFWTVLQAVVPDVLILDVNLPEINGFELCQMLRSDPHWQRLPVLFLSELSDSASQQQAFIIGADDYLCKPVMGVVLANRILSRLHRMRDCAK